MSEVVYDQREVKRSRYAVAAVFAVHGAVTGSFATRVPWIQDHASVSAGQLGLALAFPAIGASVAMPLAGSVSHRFGARTALRGLIALWTLALILPSLAPNLLHPVPGPVRLRRDGGHGRRGDERAGCRDRDPARQVDHVRAARHVERGRPGRLGGRHARRPSGLGRAAAPRARGRGAHPDRRGRLSVGAGPASHRGRGTAPAVRAAARSRRCSSARSASARCSRRGRAWTGRRSICGTSSTARPGSRPRPPRASRSPWRSRGSPATRWWTASARSARYGSSGVLATLGGLLVVVAQNAAVAMAGFALLGLGIAVVVPLCFAAAGRSGPNPSQAIAGVATITYTSGLIAPSAIGGRGGRDEPGGVVRPGDGAGPRPRLVRERAARRRPRPPAGRSARRTRRFRTAALNRPLSRLRPTMALIFTCGS